MKFSEKWLREWVNPTFNHQPLTTQTLADQLTMAGLETDGLHPVAGKFNHVIVGEIKHAEPHPKADRLHICQVDVGQKALLNIVCGAPNARTGIKVAVAMIGAVLPNGMTIQKAKLRDVVSEGMLCSAQELGLLETSEGIIELPEDAPIGKDFREYRDLEDTVIELSITPNRGDCLSIAGIAREIAALNHCIIHEPEITPITETITDTKTVKINYSEGCGQYFGRVIKNINQQAQAPVWLTERVKRSGTRSISPVVDITNYILNELGQPLHAFDLDTLQGDIVVRLSKEGEILELLDGNTVILKAGTLLIADESGPIAMAGIMGGLRTAVTEKTKNIFLESAWFAPTAITGKARQYSISTDAAYRYERGVDPTLQQKALIRAVNLIQHIVGGDVGPETQVITTPHLTAKNVLLHLKSIERLLGILLTEDDLKNLEMSFQRLGFIVTTNKENWEIQIPSHRSDLSIEADLIEEAARIYGYQKIPTTLLNSELKAHLIPENKVSVEKLNDTLVARGYQEIITYSFVNKEKQSSLYPEGESLCLLNPITSEHTVMRKGLWPGLLEAAAYNQNRQINDLRLFELGARFNLDHQIVQQKNSLSGLCAGIRSALTWNEPTRPYDFFDMKGDVESLIALSNLHTTCRFEAAVHPALHPGQSAQILSEQNTIGWVGALHPELHKQWNLSGAVFLFELDLDILMNTIIPEYQKISKFPSIRRDISFILNAAIPAQILLDFIKNQDTSILKNAEIFDMYQGSHVAENQKSLAIALTLQHSERTLIESEVNELIEKIISQLQTKFSIVLRA